MHRDIHSLLGGNVHGVAQGFILQTNPDSHFPGSAIISRGQRYPKNESEIRFMREAKVLLLGYVKRSSSDPASRDMQLASPTT